MATKGTINFGFPLYPSARDRISSQWPSTLYSFAEFEG
jgi:hypothetical protein